MSGLFHYISVWQLRLESDRCCIIHVIDQAVLQLTAIWFFSVVCTNWEVYNSNLSKLHYILWSTMAAEWLQYDVTSSSVWQMIFQSHNLNSKQLIGILNQIQCFTILFFLIAQRFSCHAYSVTTNSPSPNSILGKDKRQLTEMSSGRFMSLLSLLELS